MFKIPAHSLRHSLFVRLVTMYLIVILPLIILGVYLYNWSYKNASEEISRNTVAQLDSYLERLNREIEWLEIQQFDMLQEGELNKIAVTWPLMDGVEKRTSVYYLLHRLTSIKSSSAYIKDISIHIRSIGKTISASDAVQDFDKESYNEIVSMMGRSGSRLIQQHNELHLSASSFGWKQAEGPLYLVQIELDTDKLRESLQQLNVYPGSGSILIADEAAFTLFSDLKVTAKSDVWKAAKETDNRTTRLIISGKKYHVDKVDSVKLGLSVVSYLPEATVKRPLNKFTWWAWGFALTSVVAVIVYLTSTYRYVHRPLLLLVQRFRRMEGGALDTRIEHKQKDEFGYLYDRYNQMLVKLQTLIDQDFKQKLMMQKAELKQLQSQINPHFLYNSFFILNSLAKNGDTERIELFTNMLGEYFRFITRNMEDNVRLEEEIKHARVYTEIQKLRFSRRIHVQFDELPMEMERILVPRLIVQPIIENAYEHSLEQMPDEGMLRITFEHHPNETLIIVEDNGRTVSDEQFKNMCDRLSSAANTDEITGMTNIHRRIMLTYGEGSGIMLSRSEWNGLKVTIRIQGREASPDA